LQDLLLDSLSWGARQERKETPSFVKVTEETPSHAFGDGDGAKYQLKKTPSFVLH